MNITENDYILGLWFIPFGDSDWLASVKRIGTGKFFIEYRFRYYAFPESDAFDGRDQKNFYRATAEGKTEDQVIEINYG